MSLSDALTVFFSSLISLKYIEFSWGWLWPFEYKDVLSEMVILSFNFLPVLEEVLPVKMLKVTAYGSRLWFHKFLCCILERDFLLNMRIVRIHRRLRISSKAGLSVSP